MLMLRQDSLASRMARKSFVTTWCSVKANWYLQYVPLQETFVFCTIAIERRTVYARTITVPDNPSPLLSLKFFTQTNNSYIYIYTHTPLYTLTFIYNECCKSDPNKHLVNIQITLRTKFPGRNSRNTSRQRWYSLVEIITDFVTR